MAVVNRAATPLCCRKRQFSASRRRFGAKVFNHGGAKCFRICTGTPMMSAKSVRKPEIKKVGLFNPSLGGIGRKVNAGAFANS